MGGWGGGLKACRAGKINGSKGESESKARNETRLLVKGTGEGGQGKDT